MTDPTDDTHVTGTVIGSDFWLRIVRFRESNPMPHRQDLYLAVYACDRPI